MSLETRPQAIEPDGSSAPVSIHERHRREILGLIPRWYNPWLHLTIPSLFGLAALIFAVTRIHDLRATDLLAIPATMLLGFGFEYRAHKWILHRRIPGLGVIYDRHELQHHVVYTYDDMALRSNRELWLILVPAYAVVLIGLLNTPIAYGIAQLFGPNVGYIFLVTSMGFFLSYEWLHLSYHLPPTHPVGRLSIIARLREQHRRHHDPRLMKKWNFNVTVPLFDWIHGTTWTREREAELAARRSARRNRGRPVEHSAG